MVKRSLYFFLILSAFVPFLVGFAPQAQGVTPDPSSFVIWGVPWVLVGVVLLGLLKKYTGLSAEGSVLVSAVWTVIGFLILQNLPALESVAPWLPTYAPQVLTAILIFGAQLGLIPGTTASRIAGLVTGKR